MKTFNFIQTLSASQKRSINRWIVFSIVFCTLTCLSLLAVQMHQLYRLYIIKAEYKKVAMHAHAHTASIAQKQKLTDQVSELKNKENTLTQYQTQIQGPIDLLNTLNTIHTPATTLQSARMAKNKVEIITHCNNTQTAMALAQKLNNCHCFKKTKLSTLKPTNTTLVSCTFNTELQG